jgi:molybdopterin converting factor small subunit
MASDRDVPVAEAEVTIRYWASARAAAGCDSERFTGRDVGEVLQAAAGAHDGLGGVLAVSTVLMNGRPVTAAQPLSAATTLEVLPPFAGG